MERFLSSLRKPRASAFPDKVGGGVGVGVATTSADDQYTLCIPLFFTPPLLHSLFDLTLTKV